MCPRSPLVWREMYIRCSGGLQGNCALVAFWFGRGICILIVSSVRGEYVSLYSFGLEGEGCVAVVNASPPRRFSP